ncbi:patatin-like phospholipase family protein [Bacteroidota bacterium]
MKIGYALSGGGVRGVAHLGIIKLLEEEGIQPALISGTSAGAIVGAFYGQGYSPDEILEIIVKTKLMNVLGLAINWRGLLSLEKTEQVFQKYFPENSFDNLQIPLIVAATNSRTGEIAYFSEGDLIRPVLASSAIPVIFKPVEIKGESYIDGGIVSNLPTEPLIKHCDKIIGMHCNPIDRNYSGSNLKRLMERTFLLAINSNIIPSRKYCDIFIEPDDIMKYGALEFSKVIEIFKKGYKFASEHRKQLLPIIEK